MRSGALFSTDRSRRLCLRRYWSDASALIMVMLNPSKANEHLNDPTIERCQRRAQKLGYGGLYVVNVSDHIETDSARLARLSPSVLCSAANMNQLRRVLTMGAEGKGDILCAWGGIGQRLSSAKRFTEEATCARIPLFCLRQNKDGAPAHPLYIPYDQGLKPFILADRGPVCDANPAVGR